MSTAIDMRGRHLMKLADYTPEEITYLIDLAGELKAAKRDGREEQKLVGREIAERRAALPRVVSSEA
jgi:ornithine carbamoyltransferase